MSFLQNSTLGRTGSGKTMASASRRSSSYSNQNNALRESRLLNAKSLRRMQRAEHNSESSWHGMAFLIEAVVLLAFLAVCIAVFFRLFAYSKSQSTSTTQVTNAITYASNAAERFALDPTSMSGYYDEQDGYAISCHVVPRTTDAGTLYDATITVSDASTEETLYTLTTTAYVSGVV